MAYITEAEFDTYLETYGGTDITDESDFDQLIEVASFDIDTATYNRISNIDNLTDAQQTNVKNATCSHAQTLKDYGDSTTQINDNRKISLGDLSVDQSADDVLSRMSVRTKNFLFRTGLTNTSLTYFTNRGYWYNR